ncbi:MAG: coproporphyrinogen dehydrogenase HemZ [Bacilli bacterium]|nr:coproporphyrinogen dehydrogenase HemZ [Bacilli bacterium]
MLMFAAATGFEWREEIERLLLLFDEDLVLRWSDLAAELPTEQPENYYDMQIQLNSDSSKAIVTLAELKTADREVIANYRAQAQRKSNDKPEADETADKAQRRQGKQLVLRAVHDVMEQLTGKCQPWGILTGIRPLKLVHSRLEQGQPLTQIEQDLQKEYRITPERAALLTAIADRQLTVLPDLYQLYKEASVYVGIPFCPTHCAYCTFPAYSMIEKRAYAADFLRALDYEFQQMGDFLARHAIRVTSVYVGGGTPTALDAPELDWMLASLRKNIPGADSWREFTVEAGRPDTITPDRVEVMRKHGVGRISVNPQTFKAETLKEIGRGHTPDIVDRRFHLVKEAGFSNINMDIILGLPGEDLDDVANTRSRIEALRPDAVTVHTLSFKRTAVVNREKGRFEIPHSELVRLMMEETQAWAAGLGYNPYYVYRQRDILGNLENIGYALPGKESVYNIAIMEERQCIIGLGGGASTKFVAAGGKSFGRHGNPREPKAYVETIDEVVQKKLQLLDEAWARIE